MTPLSIACDLDDVVLDFTGGLRHAVETEYGVVVPEFNTWAISEVLDPIIGRSWWEWMRERDWLWSHFPAVPGAIGGLSQLRADGHYLELVTHKPDWGEFAVWRWIGKWRPPVQQVTIVPMDDKKIDHTNADLIIDDRPETVLQFAVDGRLGILFDRSHNMNAPDVEGVYRAKDWKHIVELVRAEERGDLL